MLKGRIRGWRAWIEAPASARTASLRDRFGAAHADPGPRLAVEAGVGWLKIAQDNSRTRDGGVARHFSLLDGWASSYPETTGYIADTLLSISIEEADRALEARALRMLDWLVSIQFDDGSFQGGMVDQTPKCSATFDTGQILIGLSAGAALNARYLQAMERAADWLLAVQDPDGCWRKINTPFAAPGEKTYETHVSIGLFRAARHIPDRGYLEAAIRQVDWALTQQRPNGWLANCCLTDQRRPLTHTLGYALRGIIEAYLATQEPRFLEAASRMAQGIAGAIDTDGRLPGRLDSNWEARANWVCLTGSAQIAESMFLLAGVTKNKEFSLLGQRLNGNVRRTIAVDGAPEMRGGVKGSNPIDGWYGKWQYLNWACKFMLDANRAELAFSGSSSS